jgi:DNA-binding transcriptional LysR family regulator
VLERARALIFEAGCLKRDLALLKQGDLGEIVVGAAPIPAAVIVPEILSRLRSESPQLMVRVRMGNLPNLLEQLEAQQIDFCLGDPRLVPANPRYAMTSLGKHTGGLYCRSTHKLARAGQADSLAMKKYGIALISMSSTMRTAFAADFGFKAVADFPQVVECDDVHTLVRLVMESDVLGFLPHTVVAQSGQKLRRLQVAGTRDAHADVHAIWLKGRTLAPAADKAVQLARTISMNLIRAFKEGSARLMP